MTIEEKQDKIIKEFEEISEFEELFGEDEKYNHIIALGKNLEAFPDEKKTDDLLIDGCQSKVWLDAKFENGTMHFSADSDSVFVKGIISLLTSVYQDENPEDIAKSELYFIEKIGIQNFFSPNRSNGLKNMVKRIKSLALSALAN